MSGTGAVRGMWLGVFAGDTWVPGIGDPSAWGWSIVAAYFAAGAACMVAARRFTAQRARAVNADTLFMAALALFLFALGVNKQLDLQSWFTWQGKQMALAQGWYEQRRVVQALFVAGLGMGAVGLIAALCWGLGRSAYTRYRLALTGMALLLAFIVVRAASFNHIDALIGVRIGGLPVNAVAELGGIALVSLGAWRASRPVKPTPEPRCTCPGQSEPAAEN